MKIQLSNDAECPPVYKDYFIERIDKTLSRIPQDYILQLYASFARRLSNKCATIHANIDSRYALAKAFCDKLSNRQIVPFSLALF